MDFLRAEKIINERPKPQFIKIKHSGKKSLKGTLLKVENNILHIQGPSLIEKIHLNTLDKISYRTSAGKYDKFKNHFAVTKMSDAIQEQKHIEYIISIINKKEVA